MWGWGTGHKVKVLHGVCSADSKEEDFQDWGYQV